jgi:hypothetical protein
MRTDEREAQAYWIPKVTGLRSGPKHVARLLIRVGKLTRDGYAVSAMVVVMVVVSSVPTRIRLETQYRA